MTGQMWLGNTRYVVANGKWYGCGRNLIIGNRKKEHLIINSKYKTTLDTTVLFWLAKQRLQTRGLPRAKQRDKEGEQMFLLLFLSYRLLYSSSRN